MDVQQTRMIGIITEKDMTGQISLDSLKIILVDAMKLSEMVDHLMNHLDWELDNSKSVDLQKLIDVCNKSAFIRNCPKLYNGFDLLTNVQILKTWCFLYSRHKLTVSDMKSTISTYKIIAMNSIQVGVSIRPPHEALKALRKANRFMTLRKLNIWLTHNMDKIYAKRKDILRPHEFLYLICNCEDRMNAVKSLPARKLNITREKYFQYYKLDLDETVDQHPDARLGRILDHTTNYKNIRWESEHHQSAKIKVRKKFTTVMKAKKSQEVPEVGEFRQVLRHPNLYSQIKSSIFKSNRVLATVKTSNSTTFDQETLDKVHAESPLVKGAKNLANLRVSTSFYSPSGSPSRPKTSAAIGSARALKSPIVKARSKIRMKTSQGRRAISTSGQGRAVSLSPNVDTSNLQQIQMNRKSLMGLTKDQLIDMILNESSKPRAKPSKPIDFNSIPQKHIALKVAYLGRNYNGFAIQENWRTIEGEIVQALQRATLIQDMKTAGYSRCGRTDKGVNALGNVISLHVRSREGHRLGEFNYVDILNRILPKDIRIMGMVEVPEAFDARFSCIYREYKYFFSGEGLDLELMKYACLKFIGNHDFRNFCKMDVVNVSNFIRRVLSFRIEQMPSGILVATIRGFAFLWHQIRCIMHILMLIGKGLESPDLIDEMLNVENNPQKPQYDLASEKGLVLYDCGFEGIKFKIEPAQMIRVWSDMNKSFQKNMMNTEISQCFLSYFDNEKIENEPFLNVREQLESRAQAESKYIQVLKRPLIDTYEDRVASLTGRKLQEKKKKTRI